MNSASVLWSAVADEPLKKDIGLSCCRLGASLNPHYTAPQSGGEDPIVYWHQGRFGSSVRINPRGDRHRLPPSGHSILWAAVPNRLRQSLLHRGQFRGRGLAEEE